MYPRILDRLFDVRLKNRYFSEHPMNERDPCLKQNWPCKPSRLGKVVVRKQLG